jgi:hypothetical protein
VESAVGEELLQEVAVGENRMLRNFAGAAGRFWEIGGMQQQAIRQWLEKSEKSVVEGEERGVIPVDGIALCKMSFWRPEEKKKEIVTAWHNSGAAVQPVAKLLLKKSQASKQAGGTRLKNTPRGILASSGAAEVQDGDQQWKNGAVEGTVFLEPVGGFSTQTENVRDVQDVQGLGPLFASSGVKMTKEEFLFLTEEDVYHCGGAIAGCDVGDAGTVCYRSGAIVPTQVGCLAACGTGGKSGAVQYVQENQAGGDVARQDVLATVAVTRRTGEGTPLFLADAATSGVIYCNATGSAADEVQDAGRSPVRSRQAGRQYPRQRRREDGGCALKPEDPVAPHQKPEPEDPRPQASAPACLLDADVQNIVEQHKAVFGALRYRSENKMKCGF